MFTSSLLIPLEEYPFEHNNHESSDGLTLSVPEEMLNGHGNNNGERNNPEVSEPDDVNVDNQPQTGELKLINFCRKSNKLALSYLIPMAVALLIMLIFHTDAREGTCKMPLHLWTQVECVLLLFSVLMGLAFETYLRLQDLDGNPVTSLSSRNFLQYIHFLSQFTFAMMFVWMVLGAFWALTTEASNSCRMLGLYQLTLALIYSQIAIFGSLVLGFIGLSWSSW